LYCEAFDRETFKMVWYSWAEGNAALQIANACFMLDNCAIQNVDDVTKLYTMFDSEFNFPPAYSLNGIDAGIEGVKRAMQAALATVLRPFLLNLANTPDGQRITQREHLLFQVLRIALPVIPR
jgi:hypothetical protein